MVKKSTVMFGECEITAVTAVEAEVCFISVQSVLRSESQRIETEEKKRIKEFVSSWIFMKKKEENKKNKNKNKKTNKNNKKKKKKVHPKKTNSSIVQQQQTDLVSWLVSWCFEPS